MQKYNFYTTNEINPSVGLNVSLKYRRRVSAEIWIKCGPILPTARGLAAHARAGSGFPIGLTDLFRLPSFWIMKI